METESGDENENRSESESARENKQERECKRDNEKGSAGWEEKGDVSAFILNVGCELISECEYLHWQTPLAGYDLIYLFA